MARAAPRLSRLLRQASGWPMAGTVAIVGAGPSGLAACKAALEEGLTPSVFEKDGGVGGLWRPSGKVWDSLRTNLSKYTCAFSDFPWPKEAETFPTADAVCRYLELFAEGLRPHIHLHCEVTDVARAAGGWEVAWLEAGEEKRQLFGHVVVASGIFESAHAEVPGLGGFPGAVVPAAEYRRPEDFAGRKVLVIGSAFSGADIAVDLSAHAAVTIACGQPMWYIPRFINGTPADLAFYSRKPKPAQTPEESNRQRHKFLSEIARMPSALEAPSDWSRPPFVCISDHFADTVRTGAISVTGKVKEVIGSTAHFADGGSEDFEGIVVATGYDLELPFLSQELRAAIHLERDQLQPVILSHCVWLAPEGFGDLAFVGIYRGPYFAVLELQARWACGVFSGRLQPPSAAERERSLERAWALRRGHRPQFPQNYVEMAEELADLVGVHPRELQSPSHPLHHLYPDIAEGPLLPFHYRLVGFKADPAKAEKAIQECRRAEWR